MCVVPADLFPVYWLKQFESPSLCVLPVWLEGMLTMAARRLLGMTVCQTHAWVEVYKYLAGSCELAEIERETWMVDVDERQGRHD